MKVALLAFSQELLINNDSVRSCIVMKSGNWISAWDILHIEVVHGKHVFSDSKNTFVDSSILSVSLWKELLMNKPMSINASILHLHQFGESRILLRTIFHQAARQRLYPRSSALVCTWVTKGPVWQGPPQMLSIPSSWVFFSSPPLAAIASLYFLNTCPATCSSSDLMQSRAYYPSRPFGQYLRTAKHCKLLFDCIITAYPSILHSGPTWSTQLS